MSSESEHPIQTAGFWIFGLISMARGFEMDGGAALVLVESDVAIAGVSRSQRALYSDGLDLLPVAQA
jgi:hypothetical protein